MCARKMQQEEFLCVSCCNSMLGRGETCLQSLSWNDLEGTGDCDYLGVELRIILKRNVTNTRWFKYDRDYLCVNK